MDTVHGSKGQGINAQRCCDPECKKNDRRSVGRSKRGLSFFDSIGGLVLPYVVQSAFRRGENVKSDTRYSASWNRCASREDTDCQNKFNPGKSVRFWMNVLRETFKCLEAGSENVMATSLHSALGQQIFQLGCLQESRGR